VLLINHNQRILKTFEIVCHGFGAAPTCPLWYTTEWDHGIIVPRSSHSPLGMKLLISPASLSFCRSMPLLSYVHEPNLSGHSWLSNGNHVMSILHVLMNRPTDRQTDRPAHHNIPILHVLMNRPGGTHRQTDRQTDRHTCSSQYTDLARAHEQARRHPQTDRQTDRQTYLLITIY